jgi:hypothetical protein
VTAGQDGKTLLFSAKDGRLLRKLTETNFGAGPVVFNSDHSLLAIGGNDGSTTVLKTDT